MRIKAAAHRQRLYCVADLDVYTSLWSGAGNRPQPAGFSTAQI